MDKFFSNSNFSNSIQAIASVVNLIIIFAFFIIERFQGGLEKRKDRKEYWYHETMLNRGIDEVEKCFKKLREYIHNAEDIFEKQSCDSNFEIDENECMKIIQDVITAYSSLKVFLACYSKLFDLKLLRDLTNLINVQEDNLTNNLEKNMKTASSNYKLITNLQKDEYDILNILYTYDTTPPIAYHLRRFKDKDNVYKRKK